MPLSAAYLATADYCVAAMKAMITEDTAGVSAAMDELCAMEAREETFPVIATAVCLWVDMLRDHMFNGLKIPIVHVVGASMVRMDKDGNETEYVLGSANADMELRHEYLWAGRIISARLERDHARQVQLWDEAPSDPELFGRHVLAVLRACARTISITERGYGLEGAEIRHVAGCKCGDVDKEDFE